MRKGLKQTARFMALFLGLVAIDQALKHFISTAKIDPTDAWLSLSPIANPGVIFGSFIDVPSMIRVTLLSALFFFIAFFLVFTLFMLRRKNLPALKHGIVLLLAGFFGNVLDRIRIGFALDFIKVKVSSAMAIHFNLADLIQLVGSAMILYSVVKHRRALWFDDDQRGRIVIDPWYQYSISGIVAGCTLLISAALILVSYSYLGTTLRGFPWIDSQAILRNYLVTFVVISLLFTATMFLVCLQLTFLSAGPIYAFRRFVDEWLQGKSPEPLKLRKSDYHPELERIASRLLEFHEKL